MIWYHDFYSEETPSEKAYFFLQSTSVGNNFVASNAFLNSHF